MNVQQRSLFDPETLPLPPILQAPPAHGQTLAERFMVFHRTNPQVYQALRQLALNLVATGRRRGSIKQLFEVLRYEYALRTQGSEYKLDNNYHSRYARLLMENEPALRGWFETRDLRS